ncbi:MAG: UDP-2,4-diacetamido-2,4,6-trideoxy-beta-L-altropyranose hydrolase [Campylobacterota bacterium]|nr:UDP-2,4-diacetamido-2,4,6-trideoxy-beta-L-altropyranose hydrolase [Campylobacterota bacterium]
MFKNILFRADSSSTIGTGHIMRDLVLAEQFKDANIIFATQDLPGNINYKIKEKNYRIEILNFNDIEELDSLIKELNIDMIVIDHYGIDYDFEKQLKIKNSTLKIMSLDDTYEKHHCDILLNHNVSANPTKYVKLVPENCEIRCGAKYTLLRNEFKVIKKIRGYISEKDTLTVFIAMGGADHSNRNIDILEVINKIGNIKVNVVTTEANKHLKKLYAYIREHENVSLHVNTDKIASLMNESDFAIVTPSVTVNEVLFMKLPFIAIQTVDNQNEIAQYLEDTDFQVLRSFDVKALNDAVTTIMNPDDYNQTLLKIDKVLEKATAS